jgi:hypothetical protein
MKLAKRETLSQNGHSKRRTATNGKTTPKLKSRRLLELAEKSGDRALWTQKFYFYVDELNLDEERAIRWANGAVSASLQARVELALSKELRRAAAA